MKDYIRYAVSVLSVVVVVVLLIVSFNLIKNALKSDPKKDENQSKSVNLIEAGKSGKLVQVTIRGGINSEEEHRSIRFTVDRSMRRVEILQGYNSKVIKTMQLPNTTQSYEAFISALNGAGYTKSLNAEGRGNESQSCPVGRVTSYEIAPGTSDAFKSWDASCNGKLGTFNGNGQLIQTLFRNQFPDYDKFISGTRLN